MQSPDGAIWVIDDFSRLAEKQILMARFTEDDVGAGRLVSPASRLRVLVNQATGVNPAGKPAPAAARAANDDGVPLAAGPGAGLQLPVGEIGVFAPGAKLFLDREYVAAEAPAALRGRPFVRSHITGVVAVCVHPGAVFVATPSAGRNRNSLAADLRQQGFDKVALPEFLLFDGEQNVCTLFQKALQKGETLALGKWGVVLVPGAATAIERVTSVELAADASRLLVWDPAVPFPPFDEMPDLDCVTHISVERARPEGFHYLHEPRSPGTRAPSSPDGPITAIGKSTSGMSACGAACRGTVA